MSKGPRPRAEEKVYASRDTKHRRNAQNLRVIQGGRAASEKGAAGGERASARRCEVPGRVRRRRRMAVAVLVVLAAGLIVYVLLGPVTRVIESRRNLSRVEGQLVEEQSRTMVLEERKAWDMTETFVEWEARKMGYVKPGEIPIIVLDYEEKEPVSESTTDNSSP